MITSRHARVLRGLVAHHARCQRNMGATAGARGDEAQRKILVEQAEKARRRLYAFIYALEHPVPFVDGRHAVLEPNLQQQRKKGKP